MRTNDGVTDDEVNTGVRTVRRIYRAHNRKMDCLKILYPTLLFLHPTHVIMVVTILDLEESEKEPKLAEPASRRRLDLPTTSKPLTKAAMKNYEVPYSYVKAALETNRIVNSGKINKRKRHVSPDRKKKVLEDTPGESSSEDFKTPVRRRSPRKHTTGKTNTNTKPCKVSIERLPPTMAKKHWGSLLIAKKAKNDEARKQATMEYNQVNMAQKLVECVESLALIQEKTGLDPTGIFRMVEES